jgi:hypothetical protein
MRGKIRAMKTAKWNILTIVGWFASNALGLAVVETTSETFVATATLIKGNTAATPEMVTYFSLPTVGPVLTAGAITGVGTTTLVDTNANWQTDTVPGGGACYIEFDSGMMADIASADRVTHTLSLYGNVPAGIAANMVYRIRKHRTIDDVFGANNQFGLKPGSINSGDNVMLHDPEAQITRGYYYHPLSNAWCYLEGASVTPAGATPIYPEQGIILKRKLSNDVLLVVHGEAKAGPGQVTVYPGWNLVGTLKSYRSYKLSELNLYTGNSDTGLVGGGLSSADCVMFMKPGETVTHYYVPGTGWRTPNTNYVADATISPGTAVFIQRKAPRPSFLWTIPSEQ